MSNENANEVTSEKLKLIEEIKRNRLGQYDILEKIKTYRENVESYNVSSEDFRQRSGSMSKAVEKAKVMTEVIKIELDVRKTIDSSTKLEFELRDKIEKDASKDIQEGKVDIRLLSTQLKLYEKDLITDNSNSGKITNVL